MFYNLFQDTFGSFQNVTSLENAGSIPSDPRGVNKCRVASHKQIAHGAGQFKATSSVGLIYEAEELYSNTTLGKKPVEDERTM